MTKQELDLINTFLNDVEISDWSSKQLEKVRELIDRELRLKEIEKDPSGKYERKVDFNGNVIGNE